jgi:hypothetical protein
MTGDRGLRGYERQLTLEAVTVTEVLKNAGYRTETRNLAEEMPEMADSLADLGESEALRTCSEPSPHFPDG